MTRTNFIEFMNEFLFLHGRNENWYDQIEDLFGISMVDELISHSYENFIIKSIERELKTDDISYLIYECNWDWDKFNSNTSINGEHPNIHDFGELYDWMCGGNG